MRFRTRIAVSIALLAALLQPVAWGNEPSATVEACPTIGALSQSLQPFVDSGELAGAVTLLSVDGRIVHLGAVGWANVAAQRTMQPDTLFSIMSMSKPVSAVAALILCDEGKLSLDDPLAKHLPEFAGESPSPITLRHVMTHTSGLFSDQRNIGSLAETVTRLAAQKPNFAPGSRWLYSPGLTVTARVVEVVSGQPFDEFVEERICRPLAMHDTTFHPSSDQLARLATLYAYDSRNKLLKESNSNFLGPLETRSPNPSAGLYATARDVFRFYQMLLNQGELDGVRILSPGIVQEMTRPQTGDLKAGFVPGSAWGLGVGIVREAQEATAMLSPGTFGHGGMYGTQAWADPQTKAIYILLIQRLGLANSDATEFRRAFQTAAAAEVSRLRTSH